MNHPLKLIIGYAKFIFWIQTSELYYQMCKTIFCISMNTASFDQSDIREQVSVKATT